MTLETARIALWETILHQRGEAQTLRDIGLWWAEYKNWEAQDRFCTAISEGRMTMRQAPESRTYGEYLGRHSGIDFTALSKTAPPKAQTTPYPSERYRVGLDSITERLNPDNFARTQTERAKYTRGLHDLSGTLMTPHIRLITDQVRWKSEGVKLDGLYVFMPLAKPEDNALFNILNAKSKELQTPPSIRGKGPGDAQSHDAPQGCGGRGHRLRFA
jgi:hypothetical protein